MFKILIATGLHCALERKENGNKTVAVLPTADAESFT
jgi:hypothetical protein